MHHCPRTQRQRQQREVAPASLPRRGPRQRGSRTGRSGRTRANSSRRCGRRYEASGERKSGRSPRTRVPRSWSGTSGAAEAGGGLVASPHVRFVNAPASERATSALVTAWQKTVIFILQKNLRFFSLAQSRAYSFYRKLVLKHIDFFLELKFKQKETGALSLFFRGFGRNLGHNKYTRVARSPEGTPWCHPQGRPGASLSHTTVCPPVWGQLCGAGWDQQSYSANDFSVKKKQLGHNTV